MIKLGSLCSFRARKRKLAYVRPRKRVRRRRHIGDDVPSTVPEQPGPLPVATLRNRGARYWAGDWLAERWAWLRPRSIPLVVAFLGMIGMLASMRYLSSPKGWSTAVIQLDGPAKTGPVEITVSPPNASVRVDTHVPRAYEIAHTAFGLR